MVAASWRSATPTIVSQTGPVDPIATGSASSPASCAMRTPSSATRPSVSADARSTSTTLTMPPVAPNTATVSGDERPADGHDQRVAAREQVACPFDGVFASSDPS